MKIIPRDPPQLDSVQIEEILEQCRLEYNEYHKEKVFRTRRIGTTQYDKWIMFEECVDEFKDLPIGTEGWELIRAKAEFWRKLGNDVKLADPNQNVNRNINEFKPTGPSRPDVILTRSDLLEAGNIMIKMETEQEERQKRIAVPVETQE